MKTSGSLKTFATAALASVALTVAHAAGPALQGQITLRPLTPQEIKDYSVTGAQVASGLNTVGVGQPGYLEALVNIAVPASDITNVTWTLVGQPGSVDALEVSPLGTNVPTYKMADRLTVRVAGRIMLRPKLTGSYTVNVLVQTASSGSTNMTQKITAANYMGISTCALCHSGGAFADDKYHTWTNTLHAVAFQQAVDGISTDHFSQNCISCHVVGYDANPLAVNGGFDDVAAAAHWTLPTVATNGNFAKMTNTLKNLANIQCENCHGAGSEHALWALGSRTTPNPISVSWSAGDCAQCHDSLTHHYKTAEWNNSRHAIATTTPSGAGRETCVRCHTAAGFAGFVTGASTTNTTYEAINCQTCHDPHDAAHPHQLRTVADVTLVNNTTITTGGSGKLCMECHMSRENATNYVEVTAGSSRFGPHHGPQTDMLEGVNAITYGKDIPSSAHREVTEDSCVTCHMQEVTSGAAFTHAGGHTFNLKWDGGTPDNTADDVEVLDACVQCHGQITTFDLKRQDYDGDGVVDGVQTEVKHLLDKLGMLLPPVGSPTVTIASSYTKPQLKAAFNYEFVLEDGSYGVHNVSYAVGLLKASIADLTGDANNDGLPDAWQIQYFGSANATNAAPTACPAGDGIPNWLKYNLGLNPTIAGVVLPDGVVWANASSISGGNDAIQIYTAAEVVFNTEVGKTYQLQSISGLNGTWQSVGDPIAGTGASFSLTTPTRSNAQQFFRVVHTP